MKLYDSIGPNPRVVRMFAAEKGIEIERVAIDLWGGENRQAPYQAKNVTGTTPALELPSGEAVCEITAICEYLEELRPSPALIGTTPEERAETRMWARRIDLGVIEPMVNGFRATEGRPLFAQRIKLVSEAAGAELKAIARDKIVWLDGQLRGRTYVCGERFTLADVLLFAFMDFGAQVAQPMPAEAAWLRDWFDRVKARPSAAA
jgi:glutathione S-transferase